MLLHQQSIKLAIYSPNMGTQVTHPAPSLPPNVKYVPMIIQAQKQQEMIRI